MSILKGIPFLRQELTKIFMKRAADKSGIMTVPFKNKKLQLDIEDRLQKYILDAQKQGVDLDMVSNENLKYTIKLNENVNPLSRAISADSPEGRKITEALLGKQKAPVVDINTGKTMDTSQGIMGGKSVAELMKSGQVTKGTKGLKKSKKVQDREMFEGANKRLKNETDNFVTNTITKIKGMKPTVAMKEANSIIGRKGQYKNLTPEQSKKILQDTEDHIFERDIPIDPEDMADGGVAGLLGERPGFKGGYLASGAKELGKKYKGSTLSAILENPKLLGAELGHDGIMALMKLLPSLFAQGGRTGFRGGGADAGGKSSPGGGTFGGGGGGNNARERYRTQQYKKSKTTTSGGGGGGSGGKTTTTPKTNTGITSNYMNPTFRKATINFLNRQQPPKSFIANLKNIYRDDVTPAKTFNTMEELIGIGAAKEGLFGNKLTSEGKTLGNFMQSSKNLATKNPNVSPSLDSVKNWMGSDVRQNTYKDYMDPNNPTQFNSTIQNAIDQGLFSDKEDFTNQVNILDLAQGGPARQNFAMGKRAFLKLLAGTGAGIAGLKSGLLGVGKGGTKKAVTETVKQAAGSGGQVPPYFLNLVKKIKMLGDDTLATQDKAIAKKYKDYTMEEDFAGNIEIIKKGDDVAEDVFMSYKVDEVPVKGKKGSTKVEEYEEYTARPDAEGKMKDVEPGVPDEVVNEGTMFEDNMTEFGITKKADGGRIGLSTGGLARMLGE